MNSYESNRSPGSIKALQEAARKVSISFFGVLFEQYYETTDPTASASDRYKQAFDQTMQTQILQDIGIDSIIETSRNTKWAKIYLTQHVHAARLLKQLREEKDRQNSI